MTLRRRALIIAFTATTAICAPIPRAEFENRIGWAEAQAMPAAIPVAIGAAAAIGASAATAIGLVTLATVLTVVSIGAGLIGSFLSQPNSPAQQSSLRLQEEESHPAFRYRFGAFRTQGQLVFRHVRGKVLYLTVLINATASESVDEIWINETVKAQFDSADLAALFNMNSAGAVPQEPWADPKGSVQQMHLWVGLGDQTKVPQKFINEIGSTFPDLATASWAGCTVLHAWCEYGAAAMAQARWWLGAPRFEFLGKWAKLYDPRKDSSLGVDGWTGAHRADDPSTWEWSANPALVALFCLREPKILGRRDEQLRIEDFGEAADDCDEALSESNSVLAFDFDPASSGAPDEPPTAETVATVTQAVGVPAGQGEDTSSISFAGGPASFITTGLTYDFVGTSETWRATVLSKSYNGDADRSTLMVTPRNISFTSQTVTIRTTVASSAASVPEGEMTLISGPIDFGLTQYNLPPNLVVGVTPVMRMKGVNPDLAVAGFHIDLIKRGFDPAAGIRLNRSITAGGTVSNTRVRLRYYTADRASNGVGATNAASFAMPADAINITLLHDEGTLVFGGSFPNPFPSGGAAVSKRYVSVLIDGGQASGTAWLEVSDFKLTVSQTAPQRYRCDGVVEVNTRDFSLLDDVLGSMGGHLDTSGGKIGVRAGVWKASVKTLPVPIGESFEVVDRSDPGFDEIVGVYIGRETNYTRTETDPYIIGIANGRRQELPLAMVREPGQAARLVAIAGERARKNRQFTAVFSGREWGLRVGDRVTTALDFYPDADGTWVVQSEKPIIAAAEDGFLVRKELTLAEDDAATYAWDPDAFDGKPVAEPIDPAPIVQPPPIDLQGLSDVSTAREAVDGGTGSTLLVPRILIHFLAPDGDQSHYEVQIDDGTGWRNWGDIDAEQTTTIDSETRVFAYVEPVTISVAYDVRVRAVGTAVSAWVTIFDVLVQPLPAELGAPVFESESYDEPTEVRTLTVRMPNGPDVRQLRVYVSDTELGPRSLLFSTFIGPNLAAEFTDTQAFTGFTRWYHATALDQFGSAGTETTQDYTASGAQARAFSTAFSRAFY